MDNTQDTPGGGLSVPRFLDLMPDSLYIMSIPDWKVRYANKAVRDTLARHGISMLGKTPWEASPRVAPLGLEKKFQEAVELGRPIEFEATAQEVDREATYRVRLIPAGGYLAGIMSDITREREAQQDAEQRAHHIESLTSALAQALTSDDVVHAVAEHVLPPVRATGLTVHAMPGGPRLVGAVGYSNDFFAHLRELDRSDVLELPKRREPAFVSSFDEFAGLWPRLADLAREGEKNAWAVLPLIASGQHVGTCVISWDNPKSFSAEETAILTSIAGLIAQALERARLYDIEHSIATRLNGVLLPRSLRLLPAATGAARYYRAPGQEYLGGHLYDLIPLASERVAIVIGSVRSGDALDEVVVTGRLRTAITAMTALDYAPDETLLHLNDIVSTFVLDRHEELRITLLYAVWDPTTGQFTVASAGHLPPHASPPGRHLEVVDVPSGPPLGIGGATYQAVNVSLPEGTLIILYTNHVDGIDDLSAALTLASITHNTSGPQSREKSAAELGLLCNTVIDALSSGSDRRDAAVMAVTTHLIPPENIATWHLTFRGEAAGEARRYVRQQLTAWGLDDLEMPSTLIVSEIAGNAIRYASGTGPNGQLCLRMIRTADNLTIEMEDGSESVPHVRHPGLMSERGRGLHILGALADRWGARYTEGGKFIWTQQRTGHPR